SPTPPSFVSTPASPLHRSAPISSTRETNDPPFRSYATSLVSPAFCKSASTTSNPPDRPASPAKTASAPSLLPNDPPVSSPAFSADARETQKPPPPPPPAPSLHPPLAKSPARPLTFLPPAMAIPPLLSPPHAPLRPPSPSTRLACPVL